MTQLENEKKRYRRMRLLFIVAVMLVLVGSIGILGGAIYILMYLGIFQLEVENIAGWFLILLMLLASVILGTIISAVLSKFVFKTANNIQNGLSRLASGDYSVRLDLGSNKESKQLAEAFNKLAEELGNTQMLRSNFINEFAHEFKTPIVSIRGFAQLLIDGGFDDNQTREYLSIIYEEACRLSLLASNALDLTRIEKQTILTDVTEYNVSEQLRACVLLLENKWKKKGVEPELNFDEYLILANEEMLKQVWINLLDNAIKFSKENGKFEISVSIDGEQIFVNVKNHGVKIPQDVGGKIFEKFFRADNVHSSEGNGVGLAIVKKIVQLHDGEVTYISNDNFTEFTVKLLHAKQIG